MEKFYIGTDIGTNSAGVACTDENYNLLRVKGKDCWTVRLFDEGKTAVDRRTFRTGRRRLQRRKQRIAWLQDLFAPYMEDETFFIRLNNSQFLPEDKDALLGGDKNTLFAGVYDDKKFHTEFPTVYHLREALMRGGVNDLRLYYLALHHIVKYRGHFLTEGSVDDVRDFGRLLGNLNGVISDVYGDEVPLFSEAAVDEAKNVLLDKTLGIKDRSSKLEKIFGVSDKTSKEIIKGLCGGKISPAVLFGDEYKEEKSFSFKEITDDNFESMRGTYGDNFTVLEVIRSIYGYVIIENLLSGHDDLSSAMIAVYDKHKKDLLALKAFIRSERPEDYNKIFKSTDEKYNYVNYIGYTKKGGDKKKVKKCKDDEFYAYIKKYLQGLTDVKDVAARDKFLKDIEAGSFMQKILHSDNGLFPKQINEYELKKILDNMVKSFPATAEIKDKIVTLFNYKIPYYVGPLAGKEETCWAVKKSNEKITPWNFDDVIDKAKSNEKFMLRMTNKCSYLRGEDVLPKASIIYQKFDTLNQLNKLRVNDELLTVDLKQKIFNELFLKYPKVSDKKIIDLLVREGKISQNDRSEVTLSGKDGEFKASMSSYIHLKNILGDFVDKDLSENGGVCENIILWHTLNTDKNIVVDLIKENYGKIPEIKNAIKQLKGLVFHDFGRLSRKLLCEIYTVKEDTGELWNVLDALYETNENLNELLNDEKFSFGRNIKEENGEMTSDVGYKDVEELYVSPAVRRGIWQTLTVVDEYVKAIGKAPDKIFVEVTREDGIKGDAGRTQSRKRRLQEKFRTVSDAYADVIAELGEERFTDLKLRQERLFLYFRQLGRCMYTGERIDLNNINDVTRYDVDHILPRTFIKDDSLDNKVLVLRSKNAKKSDTYPLPAGFSNQRNFWKMLLDKGLIAKVTYDRLTRTEPLREDEYQDFINRQKVITDQTVKVVAELFKRRYPTAKIVYSKAKNVNDFKQKFDFFKCRETNDLHHARDAYLNVVVGNVYDTVFTTPMSMYRKDGDVWRTYNLNKLFTRDVKGAWDNAQSIATVKKVYSKNSMVVTRYATCNNGGFYDQTIYGKDEKGITAPRKGKGPLSDSSKYGGYMTQPTAYFAIVLSKDKKGNEVKTIEAVPVLTAYMARIDPKAVERYFSERLKDAKIIVPKIKGKQLVSYNGTQCYLAGTTGKQILVHNAVQLFTDGKTDEYVNSLLKLADMKAKGVINVGQEEFVMKTNRDGERKLVIDRANNADLYGMLKRKLERENYAGLSAFATFRKNLEKGEEKFNSLTVYEQTVVLLQVLKFFKCNAETADTTLVGGSTKSGSIKFNNNITNVDFRLIDLSPAGLTERVRKV